MKFVNITTDTPREELLSLIKSCERVNSGVQFDEKIGIPKIKVKQKGERLHITCELLNRPSKDNGFLVGTYFAGKLRERDGVTTLRGVILTAPIYHLVLLALFAAFIVMCIQKGGFSVTPVLLLVFDYFMFSLEFKKQGIIKRYFERCVKFAYKANKR